MRDVCALERRLVFLRRNRPARDLAAGALRRDEVPFEVDVRSAALMRMPPFFLAAFGAVKLGSTRRPLEDPPFPDLFLEDANAKPHPFAHTFRAFGQCDLRRLNRHEENPYRTSQNTDFAHLRKGNGNPNLCIARA